MIKATYNDKAHIITLLAQAFADNQSVNYIVPQDKYKASHIKALMDYSFEKCFYYGEVYLTEGRTACALLLNPLSRRTDLRSIWLDITLIFKAIGIHRIQLALQREAEIKKRQQKGPIIYLWFIGVDPTAQHSGIGSHLLQEVISLADQQGLSLCLETSTVKNLPWYERFGFEVYNELDLGYKLFFLKRPHRK